MNNEEAIRRNKLYYEGLERAIAQPIPETSAKEIEATINGLDDTEESRLALVLWKEVIAPLDVVIAFIYNNRVLPQYKDHFIHDENETPFVQSEEIYAILRTLILPAVGEFLSVLPISSEQRDELFRLVENDDKIGFISHLEETHCDTMPLARLCSHSMDDVMAGLTMTDEERALSLDHLVGTRYDDDGNERCRQAAARLQPFVEDIEEKAEPDSTEQFFSEFLEYLVSQLTADLHYYWGCYDLFTLKERDLIESILDQPIVEDLVNQLREEYKAGLDKAPFTLPDDFFDWQHKSNTPKEFFYMDDALKKRGVATLVTFINWLADKGYIADDNEVKALFAYRMTGRCRPVGEKLPAIEWHGKNGKSYELIYLVRFLSDRGDYKKMRCFFTGPEWVKDRDSSYANSADTEFRIKMSEFYPEACKFVI